MELPPVILASASPRRAELLRQLDFPFQIVASDATELHYDQLTARELACVNAYRKAHAIALQFPDSLVVGADTLVYLGQRLFGKPRDLAEAGRMLGELQGQTHEVVTGVCLVHRRSWRMSVFAERTSVRFKPLDSAAIERYLASTNPLDKAGSYAIQENGDLIIEGISGSYSNVVGLPLERLEAELASFVSRSRSCL